MSKNIDTKSKSKPEVAAAFTTKSLVKLLKPETKPRGLKIVKNEAGAYTLTHGPKSAPNCAIVSAPELAEAAIVALGLKIS